MVDRLIPRSTASPPHHVRPGLSALGAGAAALALGLALATLSPAEAGRSDWVDGDQSQLRLVHAGSIGDDAAGRLLAGIEIRLDEGWKTYWRYPGDSGIPPRFDFSGSENVKTARVRYPAPVRFDDSGGQSIGYKIDVVFPVEIEPVDPGLPVRLHAKVDYAVCADICIPVFAETALDLDGAARNSDSLRVSSFRDSVPIALPADSGATGVIDTTLDLSAEPARLALTVAYGPGTSGHDLFVEGPPRWYLPLPAREGDCQGGTCIFSLPLDGIAAEDIAGAELRVTGTSSRFSFEQPVMLK